MSIRTLTQEDPIGLAGGLNLYGFAGGDPINFSDPFGLDCMDADGNRIPCAPLSNKMRYARLNGSTSTRGSGFVKRNVGLANEYQHQGADYGASVGDPVSAMYDGTVIKASDTGGGEGLSVVIQSSGAEGETTSYWHLSEALVSVGDEVVGGQAIGLVGTSGNANPAQSGRETRLHARKQVNGADVHPYPLFLRRRPQRP